MSRTRVKICCIQSVDEARLAIEAGADALGLVSHMPSGPGVIDETTIYEIAGWTPPAVDTFLLTSLTRVEAIIAQHQRCRTRTIQLVDELTDGTHADLKSALPGIKIVQVIHVQDESSVQQALKIAPQAHALLLDSGQPQAKLKTLGGTGQTHNWQLSRQIVQQAGCPVFLAGGLKPENIRQAIEIVQPYGVDICSGVRTNGRLDGSKLKQLVSKIK